MGSRWPAILRSSAKGDLAARALGATKGNMVIFPLLRLLTGPKARALGRMVGKDQVLFLAVDLTTA